MSVAKPKLHFLAVLPPPVTGMTVASRFMVDRFSATYTVGLYGPRKPRQLNGALWSLFKHAHLLLGAIRISCTARRHDAVYFVLDSGYGAAGSILIAKILNLRNMHIIVHHHVFSYFNKPTTLSRTFFRATQKATHIVLCRGMQRRLHANYGDRIPTEVLSNRNLIQAPESPPERDRLRAIGFLGNITQEKGIGTFLRTATHLSQTCPGIKIHIAGPIADPAIAEAVRSFVATDPERRRYHGAVYGMEKDKLLRAIDVLLFPTEYRNEAEPLTIYEALRYGSVVIANDLGCISEQIGVDKFLVRTGDSFIDIAAPLIEAAYQDPQVYQEQRSALAARLEPSQSSSRTQSGPT